jgi:NAD+ kinase
MKSKFRHIALVGKPPSSFPASSSTLADTLRDRLTEISRFLRGQGCMVSLASDTAQHCAVCDLPVLDVTAIGAECDLCLVVGGDGSMLGIGRQLARYGVPLIGINLGRLGFMTDIALDDYANTLAPMLQGAYIEDHRSLMHADVVREGVSMFEALALNDVVVNRGGTSGMLELRVEVDGHFVANQRVDGLIIASPTGSTAYALSAGGPLLHPSIPGWVLVPIAPHTLSNRPIVLAAQSEVTIEIVAGRDASANFDMQSLASLQHGDRIVVRRSQYHVRFLHPQGWSYFDTLRKKLHWNEGVA